MAVKVYQFDGKLAYVTKNGKQFKEDEAPVWTIRLYPRTAADRAAIKATGVKNKVQEDDGSKSGVEGLFYTFRSDAPYEIVTPSGEPIEKMVANGSEGIITLSVETFMSPKFGQQARSKLLKVEITNFIEYVPEAKADAELPV